MRLLWLEMVKMRYQKRTWIGLIALGLVPIIMTLAFYLSHDVHPGARQGSGTDLTPIFMALARNGVVMPIVALTGLTAFLFPLAASMVGAFTIAGEAETGTLKTVLVRPIRRGSLLGSKWTVGVLYLLLASIVVGVIALIAGTIAFGTRPMLMPTGLYSTGHTLWLTALAYLFVLFGMTCILSLALLFSTMTNSSLTAAIVSLVLVIVVEILISFSYFDWLAPYVFPKYFASWTDLFMSPVPTWDIGKALICFGSYTLLFTGLAWWRFRRRDILI
jgi:ABC-2 type transport system permease protein